MKELTRGELTRAEIDDLVKTLVKEWRYSTGAKLWNHVGSAIRQALLDAEVMGLARTWSASLRTEIPVRSLVEIGRCFRDALEQEGVKRRGDSPLKFAVHD